MLMFSCFAVVLTLRSRRNRYSDCGCFGEFDSPRVDLRLRAALDVAFAALAGAVAFKGAQVSILTSFGTAVCAASIAANVTMLKKLRRNVELQAQNITVDLEFTDDERRQVGLGRNEESYQAILFLHPDCPPCLQLLESARLWLKILERAGGVIVIAAPLVACRDLGRRFNLPIVASDDHDILSSALGVTGTPSIALIGTSGGTILITGSNSIVGWLKAHDGAEIEHGGRIAGRICGA